MTAEFSGFGMEGTDGSRETSLEATAIDLTRNEVAQVSVMVNFTCCFGWAVGPRYAVRHYSGGFFDRVFE